MSQPVQIGCSRYRMSRGRKRQAGASSVAGTRIDSTQSQSRVEEVRIEEGTGGGRAGAGPSRKG